MLAASIAHRFAGDSYDKSYKQTIGLDFFIKSLTLPGGVSVAVQLWDIGGQSIGGKMIKNYIYGAHAVLVSRADGASQPLSTPPLARPYATFFSYTRTTPVQPAVPCGALTLTRRAAPPPQLCYDISNYQSFQNLDDWLRLVHGTFRERGEEMPYLGLLANKADLTHLRTVKPDKHNAFADENAMYSYFMSAKTGDNVTTTFYRIAADLAGVTLSKSEVEVQSKTVTAVIVNHTKTDQENEEEAKKGKGCVVM